MRLSPTVGVFGENGVHPAETWVWVEDRQQRHAIGGVGDTLPLLLASLLGVHLALFTAMTLLRARLEPGHLGHESS